MSRAVSGPMRVFLILLNVAAVAVVGWLLLGGDSGASSGDALERTGADEGSVGAPVLRGRASAPAPDDPALRGGDEIQYDFTQRATVLYATSSIPDPSGGSSSYPIEAESTLDFRGRLVVHVLESGEQGRLLALTLEDLAVDVRDPLGQVRSARQIWEPSLRQEILLRTDPTGAPVSIDIPSEARGSSGALVRDLVSNWITILREGETWEVPGHDSTGRFVAQYERLSKPGEDPVRLQRTKLRYDEVFVPEAVESSTADVTGSATITFSDHPVLIEGSDRTVVDASGEMSLHVEADRSFRIERVGFERGVDVKARLAAARARMADAYDGTAGYEEQTGSKATPDEVRQRIAELVAAFEENPLDSQEDFDAAADQHLIFTQLLRDHPVAVEALMERLRELKAQDDVTPTLVGGLAAAGTTEAQAALGEIIAGEDWSAPLRSQAIQGVHALDAPDAVVEEKLRTVAMEGEGEIQSTALLAFSATKAKLEGSAPERAKRIEKEILAIETEEMSPAELVTWLGALGNMETDEVPEAVVAARDHELDGIRAAAAWALRGVRSEKADELLMEAMEVDVSEDVRYEVVRALMYRHANGLLSRNATRKDLEDLCDGIVKSGLSERLQALAGEFMEQIEAGT